MNRRIPLVEFSAFAGHRLDCLATAAAVLRPHVPAASAEATLRVAPILRADRRAVELLVGHFLDLMADPEGSSELVLRVARRIGAVEAREGRSLAAWHEAVRIVARTVITRLGEEAERQDLSCGIGELGQITEAFFSYADRIFEAVSAGHAEAAGRDADERERCRHELAELLLRPAPAMISITELARRARWSLPRTVAVVALSPRAGSAAGRPMLPQDALVELHRTHPVVIMPDADGPGRRHQLETGLHDWVAAVGPSVPPEEAAKSLRWALYALDLARDGLIDPDKLVVAIDHMPLILVTREPELVELVGETRLAPLAGQRPASRHDLARTLLSLIEHRFNATSVAAELLLHPQTVRYRLRKLESLFGPALYDPRGQLELHLVLHAYLAGGRPNP